MTNNQNFFLRPATENEIAAFKKALTKWGLEQPGKTETNFGEKIQIKSCSCCKVSNMQYDILVEERNRAVTLDAAKRDQAPVDAKVKFGIMDIWSLPTPSFLLGEFKENTWGQRLTETEFYIPCGTCKESCKTACETCDRHRQIPCHPCKEQGYFVCNTCRGHKVFKCKKCEGSGQFNYDCGVCKGTGNSACRSCSGSGFNIHTNNRCYECNGTGKDHCPRCRGAKKETGQCNNCMGNRYFNCGTCHGDGGFVCKDCNGSKKVECPKCDSARQVPCTDCSARGGHKKAEMVNFKSTIHTNSYFLSPVEDIREKTHVTIFADGSIEERKLTPELINQACKIEELRPYAHQLMEDIQSIKPTSTIKEKFQLLIGSFLQMDFNYQGKDYTAYVDFKKENPESLLSSETNVRVNGNPFAEQAGKVKQGLEAEAETCLEKNDHEALLKVAHKAGALGFNLEAANWTNKSNDIKNKKEAALKLKNDAAEASATKTFVYTIKYPSFFVIPNIVWIAAGFFTPLALHYLIAWNILAVYLFLKQEKQLMRLAPQKKDYAKRIGILSAVVLVSILMAVIWSHYSKEQMSKFLFDRGIGL